MEHVIDIPNQRIAKKNYFVTNKTLDYIHSSVKKPNEQMKRKKTKSLYTKSLQSVQHNKSTKQKNGKNNSIHVKISPTINTHANLQKKNMHWERLTFKKQTKQQKNWIKTSKWKKQMHCKYRKKWGKKRLHWIQWKIRVDPLERLFDYMLDFNNWPSLKAHSISNSVRIEQYIQNINPYSVYWFDVHQTAKRKKYTATNSKKKSTHTHSLPLPLRLIVNEVSVIWINPLICVYFTRRKIFYFVASGFFCCSHFCCCAPICFFHFSHRFFFSRLMATGNIDVNKTNIVSD